MVLTDLLADFVDKLGKLSSIACKVIPWKDHGSDLVSDDPLADFTKYCITAEKKAGNGTVYCSVTAYIGRMPPMEFSPAEMLRRLGDGVYIAELKLVLPEGHTVLHISRGRKIQTNDISFYAHKNGLVSEYVPGEDMGVKLEEELELMLSLFEKDYSRK